MSLISALEDLQKNTLHSITGYLRRLEYVSGLRGKEGSYEHWGLERVHGDPAAKKALAGAHRSVVSGILSTPIRKLIEDAEQSSKLAGVAPTAYIEGLSQNGSRLLPPAPGAGSARHLNSVLHALSSLLRSRTRDANPPTE
jgi:hypothetical protein